MNKKMLALISALTASSLVIYAANKINLQSPMDQVVSSDYRNKGIEVSVHYGSYVNPSEVVFDLKKVSGSNSPSDVSRVLMQYAEKLKNKQFNKVILAYNGKPKFFIKGNYFNDIGREYEYQNPIYILRSLPENVYELDGRRAFPGFYGGWLGVLSGQLESLSEFHQKWYINDLQK